MMSTADLPYAEAPPDPPTAPRTRLPNGSCDTHIHLNAAPDEFALWDGRVENPAKGLAFGDFVARYRRVMEVAGIDRVVVVHSIFYGADNAVTLAALDALGGERARGIGLVTDDVDEATLDRLAEAGIVGVRLNYVHGGVLSWDGVKRLAPRLKARGMHVQMLLNAHKHMAELAPEIRRIEVDVVLDHVGWPDIAAGPSEPGFAQLRALISDAAVYVKLSGLYRLAEAPYTATDAHVAALAEANPERCLWGSDWPHIMLREAQMPQIGALIDAFHRAVPSEAARRRILVDNPARLYRF